MQTFTEKFLDKVYMCFNELHYHYDGKHGFDLKQFIKCAIHTANRCETLKDLQMAGDMIAFIIKKEKVIHKRIINNYDYWQTFYYADNDYLSLLKEEDATDVTLTDVINRRGKDIYFSSSLYDDEIYKFEKRHGGYVLDFSDYPCPYIAKINKFNPNHGYICDAKFRRKRLCEFKLDEDGDFITLNNKSKYDVIFYKEGLGIYPKKYISHLKQDQDADDEELIAFIRWGLVNKKSKYSVSKIEFYEELNDKDELYIYMLAIIFYQMLKRFTKSKKAFDLISDDK